MENVYKENLYNQVIGDIYKNNEVSAIKSNMLQGERTLSSFEYEAGAMMTFVIIMMVMGCVTGYHMDKENGSFKRIMSTPITRLNFFNLDLLIFFIVSFVYGLVFILSFRIAGFAFKGTSPINILAILLCQSMLVTALAGLFIAFTNKKNYRIIITIIMYFQLLFGGVFIPIKEIPNGMFTTLSKFAPGNVVSEAYRNCIIFNSFDRILKYLLIMLVVSIAAYIISILKVKIRWEE
jgi:ABC-2 type transport system permease protein